MPQVYIELCWLTECVTGTFWLTDRDKVFKTGRMVCLATHRLVRNNLTKTYKVIVEHRFWAKETSQQIAQLKRPAANK